MDWPKTPLSPLSPRPVRYAAAVPSSPAPTSQKAKFRSLHRHFRSHDRTVKGFMLLFIMCAVGVLLYAFHNLRTERTCQPSWTSYPEGTRMRIIIVTMTDSALRSRAQANMEKANKWKGRNFEGVLDLTRDNKERYAKRHGYLYEDASWIVSDERPASWSKILAVKHHLKDSDWVMWLDADTIITNPDIRLESLLPRSSNGPDFVITVDSGGYNAGIWLLRRSEWSSAFLDKWWSMKEYVLPPGGTKSGDNDALKALLDVERRRGRHVGIAPQCSFNSYVWRSRIRDWWRLVYMPRTILSGLHRPGDFMLHLAGIDDKRVFLEHALEEVEGGYKRESEEQANEVGGRD